MGCTTRDNFIRNKRKYRLDARSTSMQNDHSSYGNENWAPRTEASDCSVLKSPASDACCKSACSEYRLKEAASKPYENHVKLMLVGLPHATEIVNNADIDWQLSSNSENVEVLDGRSEEEKGPDDLEEEADWGYCTEVQLEDLLLKNLEFLYNESISTIASIGYSIDVALKAVLKNGHCYGSRDALSNIVQNSLAYLSGSNGGCYSSDIVFTDLEQLKEYTLAEMVCLIEQVRPNLSKGDAMWCLLMSNLDVGQAIALEIPTLSLQCERMVAGQSSTADSVVKPSAQINVASLENSYSTLYPEVIDLPSTIRPCCSSVMPLGLSGSFAYLPRMGMGSNFMDTSTRAACSCRSGMGRERAVSCSTSMLMDLQQNAVEKAESEAGMSGAIVHDEGSCTNSDDQIVGESEMATGSSTTLGPMRRNAATIFPDNSINDSKLQTDFHMKSSTSSGECFLHSDGTSKVQMEMQIGNSSENRQSWTREMGIHSGNAGDNTRVTTIGAKLSLGITPILGSPSDQDRGKSRNCSDVGRAILGSLQQMGLLEKYDDSLQSEEVMLKLMHWIKELEIQLKERTEWAHQKAMQAARKLSKDLAELNMLRMEREETLHLKKDKQAPEDATLKRLTEMENALRKASAQVDRTNAAVRSLEIENAEERAEMEAAKLSAAESVATCREAAKREKRCLKRAQVWEKQKSKLQGEIADAKQKIAHAQVQLSVIKDLEQETEIKLRQEENAKERANLQAEAERRSKDAAENNAKQKEEALRRKTEVDVQRYRDDIHRLEQELAHLKVTAQTAQQNCTSTSPSCMVDGGSLQSLREMNARLLHDRQELQESSRREVNCDRECVLCMNEEMSVLFLPCAHQIVCVKCNALHEKQGLKDCPSCRTPIQQRIRVYGVNS